MQNSTTSLSTTVVVNDGAGNSVTDSDDLSKNNLVQETLEYKDVKDDISTGDGNDSIQITHNIKGDVNIDTGAGDDSIDVGNSIAGANINTEDGDDSIIIGKNFEKSSSILFRSTISTLYERLLSLKSSFKSMIIF